MNCYTQQEIEVLLETRSPEQILEQERDRLDEAGLALLAEVQQSLAEADDFAKDWGRQYRDSMPAVPRLVLDSDDRPASGEAPPAPGQQPGPDATKRPGTSWWHRSRRITNPVQVLAAALVVGFASLFFLAYQGYLQPFGLDGMPHRTRGGTDTGGQVEILNQALYDSLLARGKHFLEEGTKKQDRRMLKEALVDLTQARDLNENVTVLTYLALAYEELGNQKKADEITEMLLAMDDEDGL